jgi:hypothetical protein
MHTSCFKILNIELRICVVLFVFIPISCKNTNKSTVCNLKYTNAGHILIPITIENKTIDFVFDTGSSSSLINIDDTANLDLSLVGGTQKVKTLYKEIECSITEKKSFKINNTLSGAKTQFLMKNLNIAGVDIINLFCWHFDFKKQKVNIYKGNVDIMFDNYIELPYYWDGKYMLTSLTLNDYVKCNAFIDLGCSITNEYGDRACCVLRFFSKNSGETHKITEKLSYNLKEFKRNEILYGDDKFITDIFIYDSLKINNYIMSNCMIILNEYYKYSKNDYPLLTLDFFKQFEQMYIDTEHYTIYLKPY